MSGNRRRKISGIITRALTHIRAHKFECTRTCNRIWSHHNVHLFPTSTKELRCFSVINADEDYRNDIRGLGEEGINLEEAMQMARHVKSIIDRE